MAKDNDTKNQDTTPEMLTIEQLAQMHSIPDWMFSGMKTACAWGSGKEMTEQDFLKARDKWLAGPLDKGAK